MRRALVSRPWVVEEACGWFFGTAPPIPNWAGYSIGFAMTSTFLAADLSRSASGLYDEPASSFIQ
ncbi:MAG TPA: hypothetical protein QGG47_08540 [Acidobacteriota bacterium]|nr:hypothetical protein [Acidobacteriota bacterium]